jgi:hypothetical protein
LSHREENCTPTTRRIEIIAIARLKCISEDADDTNHSRINFPSALKPKIGAMNSNATPNKLNRSIIKKRLMQ